MSMLGGCYGNVVLPLAREHVSVVCVSVAELVCDFAVKTERIE